MANTFSKRMAARCVNAARLANHEAIRLRRAGDIDSAEVAREFAQANIRQAKQSKQHARQCGEWS